VIRHRLRRAHNKDLKRSYRRVIPFSRLLTLSLSVSLSLCLSLHLSLSFCLRNISHTRRRLLCLAAVEKVASLLSHIRILTPHKHTRTHEITRAHACTPATLESRMPSSA